VRRDKGRRRRKRRKRKRSKPTCGVVAVVMVCLGRREIEGDTPSIGNWHLLATCTVATTVVGDVDVDVNGDGPPGTGAGGATWE